MKFLKPLLKKNKTVKPKSFGEKRSMQMNQALEKAKQEHKSLVKKEYMSPDPLNKAYQQKGDRLDARIRSLKDESR